MSRYLFVMTAFMVLMVSCKNKNSEDTAVDKPLDSLQIAINKISEELKSSPGAISSILKEPPSTKKKVISRPLSWMRKGQLPSTVRNQTTC